MKQARRRVEANRAIMESALTGHRRRPARRQQPQQQQQQQKYEPDEVEEEGADRGRQRPRLVSGEQRMGRAELLCMIQDVRQRSQQQQDSVVERMDRCFDEQQALFRQILDSMAEQRAATERQTRALEDLVAVLSGRRLDRQQ